MNPNFIEELFSFPYKLDDFDRNALAMERALKCLKNQLNWKINIDFFHLFSRISDAFSDCVHVFYYV
ncbi:hypothetical protein MKD35_295 [Aureococcus anophagefferens virus]|nr:hypothetical protein MKD35_295 [Aureococcus anophagefferens virus]